MGLTLRNIKGSKLTTTELDGNFTYLEGLSGNGPTGSSGTSGTSGTSGISGATGSGIGIKSFQTLTQGAGISWDYTLGYNASVLLTTSTGITITGATNGDYGTLKVTQDSTGGRRINFPAGN